jgi:hypothetical protein
MPEIAQAWESCARNSLPRRWNAVHNIYPQRNLCMNTSEERTLAGPQGDECLRRCKECLRELQRS